MQRKPKTTRIASASGSIRKAIQASSSGIAISDTELIQERQKIVTTEYIPFFKESNNVYINDLARRTRRSSTHSAILKSKLAYIVGQGFAFDAEPNSAFLNWVGSVNEHGENLRDVFSKVSRDYTDFGNAYIQVVRSGGRVNLYHVDATTVRISKDKKVAILSNYWREIGTGSHHTQPSVEVSMDTNEPVHIVQLRRDAPEYNYYGLPDYIAAMNWIDIEYRIPKFNQDRFDNGFFPSALIQMFGAPPEGQTAQQYVKNFVRNFTGEGNNSKIVAELLDSPDQAANIHTFENEKQGEFEKLAAMAKVNIISAHRIPPSLAMVETAGKLGSNQELIEAHSLFLNTVVIPDFQEPLLRLFNRLISEAGFNTTISIKQLQSLTLVNQIDPSSVLTVNEQRELLGYEPIEGEENGD